MSKKPHRYFPPRPPEPPFPPDFWWDEQPIITLLLQVPTLGSATPAPLESALALLEGLETAPLLAKHAGAVMLGGSLLHMIPLIDTRQRQHKRALGGKARPLDFDLAELEQSVPDYNRLPTKLYPLCQMLLRDTWVVLRLARAMRDLYQRKSPVWRQVYRALGVVLIRMLLVWKQLRRFNGPWVAIVCLRWAMREVWGTLFGAPVRLTKTATRWLTVELVQEGQQRYLLWRLGEEGRDGRFVPGPFAPLLARWLAQELPPAGVAAGAANALLL